MPFYDKITKLDIENSSICNANCPQCTRELYGNDHSWFDETYLSTSIFDKIPKSVYEDLQIVLFSGSMGDPCAAPNFLEVIAKVKNYTNAKIKINTNGALKSITFWQQLANILDENDEVTFAIDGLEDTNHIYRVNVSWNKLMENSHAFIQAGGNAIWKFIAFKHNQHQVETAKELSQKLKFNKFEVVKSHRFLTDEILNRKFFGSNGVLIEPPTVDDLKYNSVKPLLKMTLTDWLKTSEYKPINCLAQTDKSIYIDSKGNVFPCCFLGSSIHARRPLQIADGWDKIYESQKQAINLYENELTDILTSEFYKLISESWNINEYKNGRIATCVANCGDFEGRVNRAES